MTPRALNGYKSMARARLHFGLLQVADGRVRRFGGLGLFLKEPKWELVAIASDSFDVCGQPLPEELASIANGIVGEWRSRHHVSAKIRINSLIPLHIGLGSKTSFVLALSGALAALRGGTHELWTLVNSSGRGRTSGIGISAFNGGGFTWDMGVSSAEAWLPSSQATWKERSVTSIKLAFPERPVLLARQRSAIGLHGSEERKLFLDHLPLRVEEVESLAATVSLDLIPAVATGNLVGLIASLRKMQNLGFKRIEWSIQSQQLKELRTIVESLGGACALSSMGPTVGIFAHDLPDVIDRINRAFGGEFHLEESQPMNQAPLSVTPLALSARRDQAPGSELRCELG